MISISGASGKTGQALCRALVGAGHVVRALVRRPQQFQVMERCGAAESRVVDLADGDSLRRAIVGSEQVVHICPNLHPDEIEIGRSMIAAAEQEEVDRLVYFSVLHPQTERMPHHWKKLRVEELLIESSLRWTIVQPAPYMQNVLGQWQQIATEGCLRVPYAASSSTSLVDLEDVGAAVAEVLGDERHAGSVYQLCGERRVSVEQIGAALSRSLGRTIEIETQSPEQWARSAAAQRFSPYQRETLTAMFQYYQDFGLCGGTTILAWLLGRSPTRLEQMLSRIEANDR